MMRANPTSPLIRETPRNGTARPRGARKSLGQNFLMHSRIAERIAIVSGVDKNSVVLEIGPGTGMLTRALLQRAGKVIAVETDKELFEKLETDFANEIGEGRLELIHGDIRSWFKYFYRLLPTTYCLVANIPYYLTGEIFRMFFGVKNQLRCSSKSEPRPQASGPNSMTLLVQKEVADRIVARNNKESILSLSVKAYGTPKREFLVPRGAFKPAPNVDSAVLTISDISRKNFKTKKQEELFFKLLHAGFAHKRKFVRNNLEEAGFSFKKSGKSDIPEKARAEDLSLSAWLDLARVR